LPIDFDKKGEIQMGGSGSGNWWHTATGYTVEDCLSLDVNKLVRDGLLAYAGCRGSITWKERGTGKITATAGFELASMRTESADFRLSYTVGRGGSKKPVIENLYLQTTNPHLGGVRWWFTCPNCGRRVAKLYIPPRDEFFLCRHCYRLTYQSQRESPMFRLLGQAQKIRARLGGSTIIDEPFPKKPKYMHWRTYERWHSKAKRYERSANLLLQRLFASNYYDAAP
jgi:hypothetical protein